MESSRGGSQWAIARFREMVSQGGALALDEMSFLITAAILNDENFDLIGQMARLDEIAASVPSPTVAGIATYLFSGPDAFVANRAEYYDPDNSLLSRVIDRHAGIPITLSIVLIEVARRLGVPLVGVAMPGHFLVGVPEAEGTIPQTFVDPFGGGAIIDERGCEKIFHALAGSQQTFDRLFLSATHPMAVIERMLNNLKAIYVYQRDIAALRSVMCLRSCFPGLGPAEADEFRRLMAPLN